MEVGLPVCLLVCSSAIWIQLTRLHVLLSSISIVDALYFTVVCFSTVGYGDLCPSTRASKLFTVLFGMGGIAFLGAAVAAVGKEVFFWCHILNANAVGDA